MMTLVSFSGIPQFASGERIRGGAWDLPTMIGIFAFIDPKFFNCSQTEPTMTSSTLSRIGESSARLSSPPQLSCLGLASKKLGPPSAQRNATLANESEAINL